MTASGPFLNTIVTSVGLAMDCTAIAVTYGLASRGKPASTAIKLSLSFGFFQGLLFILGWFFGMKFRDALGIWDHWIAFILLGGIGGKMVWESFVREEGGQPMELTWIRIILLGLAASIDAMAVGLGFSLVGSALLVPSILIGLFSFFLPLLGFHASALFGARLALWAERFGGVVLILIGAKILSEHLIKGI